MNKQELIEQIKCLKNIFGNKTKYIEKDTVIKLISELDEPQKVVVPQFVAEWYEEHKDSLEVSIFDYVYKINEKEASVFKKWFVDSTTRSFQILVNMHQFGYEVEKEKRYLVKLKGFDEYDCYLNKGLLSKKYFLESKTEIGGCRTKHTRKELEADGFGWVFDCEGVEVEEVEA